MPHTLHSLFYPHSIAVVGASDRSGSTGRSVFSQLAANQAAALIIPVNPQHKTISGRKAYPNLTEANAEYPIDTAVLILAADKLAACVKEAAKCGIRNLIVINEIEQPSAAVRTKLKRASEAAAAAGIRLLSVSARGLSGLFCTDPAHSCAFIGQSAAIADCMAAYAQERGIAFNRFIVLNPQPEDPLGSGDIINQAAADPAVKSLLIHIGSADHARSLFSALAAAARRKPVVVLATLSDPQQQALLTQALERSHILNVGTLTGFFTAAKLIHTGIISRGNRLSLISNSAQIGALALHALADTPLSPADPGAAAIRAVSRLLPEKPAAHNPLYLPADTVPAVIQAAAEHYLADEHSDAVLLIYTGADHRDSLHTARMVAALQQRNRKPLLLVWMGSADTADIRNIFNQHKNLHFKQSEHALHALEQLNLYREHQRNFPPPPAFHDYRPAARAAAELAEHIRPLLPVAVLPAGRHTVARLMQALNLTLRPRHNPSGSLKLSWERGAPFGQVLTLTHEAHSVQLLPPIGRRQAEYALQRLDWPEEAGAALLNWLPDAAEIFSRSPEIHSCQLTLKHDPNHGLTAIEAKLNLQEPQKDPQQQNLYAPYPLEAEQSLTLKDGRTAFIRPVRPEDAGLIAQLVARQSEHSRRSRFMSAHAELPPALLYRLSHTDYARDFALIMHDEANQPLATANYITDADGQSGEFGISIADELQGQGIGLILMNALIGHARSQGLPALRADILADNLPMQKLAQKLGFSISPHSGDNSMVDAHLPLPPEAPADAEPPARFSDSLKARIRQQINKRT